MIDWTAAARYPRFKRPYTELVYQPMLEPLFYLRANGFKTFIVSGGGIEFMRPWTEKVYGIPPEQVVGSSGMVKFQFGANGKPELMKLAKNEFVDDGPGKPVGIVAADYLRQLRAIALEPCKPRQCRCRQVGSLRQADQGLSAVASRQSAADHIYRRRGRVVRFHHPLRFRAFLLRSTASCRANRGCPATAR